MPDPYRKVMSGQPPVFNATLHNAVVDSVRDYQGRLNGVAAGAPGSDFSTVEIKLQNLTGQDLDRYATVALGRPIITYAENNAEFLSRVTFEGILPGTAAIAQAPAVLLESLAAGRIGRAAVGGVVPVLLSGSAGRRCDLVAGETAMALRVGGRFQVIHQEPYGASVVGLVRLAGRGPIFAEVTAVRDQGVTYVEHGWRLSIPVLGEDESDGAIIGKVRAYVRIDVVTEGGTVNEVQSVAIVGAESGTFTLTFSGQTTSALDWDCTAGELETALEALSNITAVTVTGSGTYAAPFLVTFNDDTTNKALMTATITSLLPDYSQYPAFDRNNRATQPGKRISLWDRAGDVPQVNIDRTGPKSFDVWLSHAIAGTYTLAIDGTDTSALAFDANAATIEAALLAAGVETINSVTVTLVGDHYEVEVDCDAESAALTADVSGLVGDLDFAFDSPMLGQSVVTSVVCVAGALTVTETDV